MKYNYHYYREGSFGAGITHEEEGTIEAHTPKSLKHKITQRLLYLRRGNWNCWKSLINGTLVKQKDLEFGAREVIRLVP